jgi:hypothetical protein
MSYLLALTPTAEAKLDGLPPPLAHFVREQFEVLLQNPVALSRPAPILYSRGQLYEIHDDRDGASVWVSIIFRYGQDEATLHVEDIVAEFG